MQNQTHLSLLLHIQDEGGLLFFFFHQCIHLANLHPFQQSHNLSQHRYHMYGFANNCRKYLHFSSVRCTQENMGSCNSSATQFLNQLRSNTVINQHQGGPEELCSINPGQQVSSVSDTWVTDYSAARPWLLNS